MGARMKNGKSIIFFMIAFVACTSSSVFAREQKVRASKKALARKRPTSKHVQGGKLTGKEPPKGALQDDMVKEIQPLDVPTPNWTKVEYTIKREGIKEIIFDSGSRNLEILVSQGGNVLGEDVIKMELMYKVDPFSTDNDTVVHKKKDNQGYNFRRPLHRKKETPLKKDAPAILKGDINSLENIAFLSKGGKILSFKNLFKLGDKNFPFRVNLFMPLGIKFSPYGRAVLLRGDMKPVREIQETTVVPKGTAVYRQEAPVEKTAKNKGFLGIF